MSKIEGFRVKKYKVLRDITLGKLWNAQNTKPLAPMTGESWYLGDLAAVKKAYPSAKDAVLNSYSNDSICGTWEKLADAVFSGGAKSLSKLGGEAIGKEKASWAKKISPFIDADNNLSPSFCYFRDKLRRLSGR
jgi:hypothetical protein